MKNIKYTLDAVNKRLNFHKRRLNEVQNQKNKDVKLENIHLQQIRRFEALKEVAEIQGYVYIDSLGIK